VNASPTAPSGLERRLREVVADVRRDEPTSRHVLFRIGGPADLMAIPRSSDELRAAVAVLFEEGHRPVILGNGSNVLIGDRGIRGTVVKIGKGVGRVRIKGAKVIAEAGAGLPALALRTARKGLAGLEFAAGIPGSVGGAVVMNAGAYGHSMAEVFEAADVLTPDGPVLLGPEAMGFGYRTTAIQATAIQGRPWVMASVTLALRPDAPELVQSRMQGLLERRGATQPIGRMSAGCFFRNPSGDHAGRLIEAAGCKGLAVGGARVSQIHANYIVNEGGATAADVLALAAQVRGRLQERLGITLELEVKLLGEF